MALSVGTNSNQIHQSQRNNHMQYRSLQDARNNPGENLQISADVSARYIGEADQGESERSQADCWTNSGSVHSSSCSLTY